MESHCGLPYLIVIFLIVALDRVVGQNTPRPCPATDSNCQCNYDSHQLISSIVCSGLGQRMDIPYFNISDDIIPTLIIEDADIFSVQTSAFSNLKVRNLLLNDLNIAVVEPGALTNLSGYLESLELKRNRFVMLPDRFLYNFTLLRSLSLDGNKLDFIKANWLMHLNSLQYLSFGNNEIRDIEQGAFSYLPSLKVLHLTQNRLSSLGEDIFSTLGEIDELGIADNKITSLPQGLLLSLQKLRWIDMTRNLIEEIPDGFFRGTTALKELYLSSNKLTEVKSASLPMTNNLEILTLSSNNISILYESSFTNSKALRRLSMDLNNIKVLPEYMFEKLQNLRILHLQENEIDELPPNNLVGLLSLEELDLHDNNIKLLPLGIFDPLGALTKLDLSGNIIDEVHTGPFDALRKLKHLNLRQNMIDNIRVDWFRNAKLLEDLYLNHNVIREIERESFSKVINLRSLYLDYNYIQEIDTSMFEKNEALQVLSLAHNPLKVLPPQSFVNQNNLKSLRLNYTCLKDVTDVFKPLPNLEELFLDHSPLEAIHDGAFAGLNQLRTLNIGHHNITTFEGRPFVDLEKLRILKADNMALTSADIFRVLVDLPMIEDLSLTHNRIQTVNIGTFGSKTNLGHLRLGGNPFMCDCRLAWLRTFQPWNDAENTLCDTPEKNVFVACFPLDDQCSTPSILPSITQLCQAGNNNTSETVTPELNYQHCIVPPRPTTPPPTTTTTTPTTTIPPIDFRVVANYTELTITWDTHLHPNVRGYRVRYRQFATNVTMTEGDLDVNETTVVLENLVSGLNYIVCVDIQVQGGFIINDHLCKEVNTNPRITPVPPTVTFSPSEGKSDELPLLPILIASVSAIVVIFIIIVTTLLCLRKTRTRFAADAKRKEDRDRMVKDKMGQWVTTFAYDGNVNETMGEQMTLDFDIFSGSKENINDNEIVANGDGPSTINVNGVVANGVAHTPVDEESAADVSGSDPGYGESVMGYDNSHDAEIDHGDPEQGNLYMY